MRLVSPLGDAARDAAAGQLQLQPRGGGRERGSRPEPASRSCTTACRIRSASFPPAERERTRADGRDRRPPQRRAQGAAVRSCEAARAAARCRVRAGRALGRRCGRRAARRRDAERDAHRLGGGGRARTTALPPRVGVRAGLRARGLRPVGGGGDAGRLHPGHDARRRAARGRRRHRRPDRRSQDAGAARAAAIERALDGRRAGARRRASGCSSASRSRCAREGVRELRRGDARGAEARGDDGQPLQRHADTPDRGDAPRDGGRRGRRRAALRRPDRQRAPGAGRGAARQGGGALPALRARCATRSASGCTCGRAATR